MTTCNAIKILSKRLWFTLLALFLAPILVYYYAFKGIWVDGELDNMPWRNIFGR